MYESIEQLMAEKSALEEERERLKQEVKKLQMKRDALEVAGIMLKKFGGIDLKTMNNREKTIVIDALKEKYRLADLLKMLDIMQKTLLKAKKLRKRIMVLMLKMDNGSICLKKESLIQLKSLVAHY